MFEHHVFTAFVYRLVVLRFSLPERSSSYWERQAPT